MTLRVPLFLLKFEAPSMSVPNRVLAFLTPLFTFHSLTISSLTISGLFCLFVADLSVSTMPLTHHI